MAPRGGAGPPPASWRGAVWKHPGAGVRLSAGGADRVAIRLDLRQQSAPRSSAGDWRGQSGFRLGPLDQTHDKEQNHGADHGRDQGAEQPAGGNAQQAEQEPADESADDTDDNVAQQTEATAPEFGKLFWPISALSFGPPDQGNHHQVSC